MIIPATVIRYLPQILVFLSGLGFAVQGLYIGILSHKDFSNSFEILFFRGIFQIAFSSYFVWQNYCNCKAAGEKFSLIGDSPEAVRVLILSSILVFLGLAFLFLALDNISLSYALVIDRQSTLFNAIFAFLFLGEPWLPVEFIAAMISIVGVFFVAQPKAVFGGESSADDGGHNNYVLGFVFGILGALCSAANFTAIRALGTTVKMHWANVIFVQSIAISVLSIPTIYASGHTFQTVSPTIGFYIVAGCLIGALGQVIITIGLQMGKAASTSVMGTSQILFGFVLQAAFTDDVINYLSIIGGLLVMVGIVLMILLKPTTEEDKSRETVTGDMLEVGNVVTNPLPA